MIHIEKSQIRKIFYLGSISSILLVALTLSLFFTESLTKEYHNKINQLSSGLIEEKKRFLKNAVDRTIYMIGAERELTQKQSNSQNLSPDQINKLAIERIGNYIRNIRLIDDGYIWINQIINYDGGKDYAIRLIHPNLPDTEGTFLSTDITDSHGNHPYEDELNGIKEQGEAFFDYYFKKMNSDEISHKMSYAKLYKPYDWVIATGVYLDDIDMLIASETEKMQSTHRNQLMVTAVIASVATLIAMAILILFDRQINELITFYDQKIKDYTDSLLEENRKTEKALAEIKQLKGMLPICSSCKKIRDDEGYWNQIESYICKHSEVAFSHGFCPDCYEKEIARIEAWKKNKETRL